MASIEKITKQELKAILKEIYKDVDDLGASSIRYWIIRIFTGETVGSKQVDHHVQDHVIEKVRGSAVKSGKYIFVERQEARGFDFSIQRNPSYRLNTQLQFTNYLTAAILAVTCYYIAYPIIHDKKPDVKSGTDSTVTSIKKTSDTTKPVTALSARVVTVYLENTKKEIATITRFSLGGTDSVYYLLFLDGKNGSYGDRYDGFNFESREQMKHFISFLGDTEIKHDLTERVSGKSNDGKNLTIMWLGKELVVYVNHGPYMRCLPSTLKALNVL
jgi:hypothetical protein